MIRINNKDIQIPQPGGQPVEPNAMPVQSPDGMPDNTQTQGDQGGMTPEEMSADLEQLMSKVQSSYQNFSTQKIKAQNQHQGIQEETLNQIFEILAKAGVDGTDPEQMNAFLQKLQASSPELYQYFEAAITPLLGGDTSISGQAPDMGMGQTQAPQGIPGV